MRSFQIPHTALGRAACTLTLVLTAYWLYALLAVPLIEPRISRNRGQQRSPGRLAQRAANGRQHADIEQLFGPDDWERQGPIVLENDRGKLLIGEYRTAENGSVEISPCTIIIFPDGEFESEEERIRQAIVLQASEKAQLAFDEPFDIRKGRIGKLIAGSLIGPILIRSDQKEPGPADDLWIETRDVLLTEDRIFTSHAVKLRWGANYGSGRQMQIELLPDDDGGRSRGPRVGGLKSFELARDVTMHLVPTAKDLRALGTNAAEGIATDHATIAGPGNRSLPLLPIEVSCQGPFRFDLRLSMATFRDRVDILQIQPNGPSDQISGELLALYFGPKLEPGAEAKPDDLDRHTKLEAKRLEVKGNPVTIHSPLHGIDARGQRLEYDVATRRISLTAEQEVIVTRAGDEMRAQQLHYQPGESGRIGRFLASGAGWLRATFDKRTGQPFEAAWSKQLWVRPDPYAPQVDVVSLEGNAQARLIGSGGLKADDIHCWLIERPLSGTRGEQAPGEAPSGAQQTELAPDRLLARGNVEIDSPQLTGLINQLEVWFDSVLMPAQGNVPSAASVSYAPVATANVAPPAAEAQPQPASRIPSLSGLAVAGPNEPAQRFDVSGQLLRVKLALLGWDPELSELIVDGQARFEETKAVQSGAKPTVVEGDRIHLVQTSPIEATVAVTGNPAHVNAGGMSLTGGAVQVDRGANRIWIDGPGAVTMSIERDMQGQPLAQPQPLEVHWQQRMNFDGLTATFERSVVARSGQQQLQTQVLKILLSQRIDFTQKQRPETRPDVAEIICQGGAFIDSRQYDEQGLSSIEHMELADLALNMATGAIVAHGKGRLTQVRRGGGRAGFAMPGMRQEAGAPDGDDPNQLSYLQVAFNRALRGNMKQRELVFGDDVQTIYGPVQTWESVLDPENLGPRGVEMTCEQLKLREMPGSSAQSRFVEMEALGNTDLNGTTFRAKCAVMRYSSQKQKLELEGDGRRDAEIWQQSKPGAPLQNTRAAAFEYWPQDRRFRINKAKSSNINQVLERREEP